MAYVWVRGFHHYYEWVTGSGNPEPAGKPVMVFVHGWGGSARYWESTARALSDSFDCLLYDMRGFGRSRQAVSDSSTRSKLTGSKVTSLSGLCCGIHLMHNWYFVFIVNQ